MALFIQSKLIFACLLAMATLQAGHAKPTTISDASPQDAAATTVRPSKLSRHMLDTLQYEAGAPPGADEGALPTAGATAAERLLKKVRSKSKKISEEYPKEDVSGEDSSQGWGEEAGLRDPAGDAVVNKSKTGKGAAKVSGSHKKSTEKNGEEMSQHEIEVDVDGAENIVDESKTNVNGSETNVEESENNVDGSKSGKRSKTRKGQLDTNETASKKHISSKKSKSMFDSLPEETEHEFQKYKEAEKLKNEELEAEERRVTTTTTTTTAKPGHNTGSSSASATRAACCAVLTGMLLYILK